MKFKDHKLQLTVLILLFLPLFGWGCAKESTVSNQSETGQDTVASVDTSVSIDATKPTDISTPDTLKPIDTTKPLDITKPEDTLPDTMAKDTTKDVNNVPEGWKVYKNQVLAVIVPYPGTWHYQEKQLNDRTVVFFDSKPISDLPESDVSYPIDLLVTTKSQSEVIKELEPHTQSVISSGNKTGLKLIYASDLLDQDVVVYLFAKSDKVYVLSAAATGSFLDILDTMAQKLSLGGE